MIWADECGHVAAGVNAYLQGSHNGHLVVYGSI